MAILITTENLGENPVLTSVANELDLTTTWIRSGDGLIGFGEYKKIELTGEDRFEKAKGQSFLDHFHLILMKNQSW